ncbi:MAG: shikimate dehydrogenase family protein, partial [Stellaceae bacterium]
MKITGSTRLAGIMGWPVTHSRSPLLHGFWLDQAGIDGAYLPLPVRPENIEAALRGLPALGFRGCNLTIPHKLAALDVLGSHRQWQVGAIDPGLVEPKSM